MTQSPIFHDPGERRWRRFKLAARLAVGFVSVAFGALVTSVLVNPVLPSLGLSPAKALPESRHVSPPKPARPVGKVEYRYLETKRQLAALAAAKVPPRPVDVPLRKPEVIAFFVNWDDTSLTSLKENIARIDKLIPEWLHLADETGALTPDDPQRREQTLAFVRARRPGLAIVPLVNNFNSASMTWEAPKLAAMLRDPKARRRCIDELLRFVRGSRLDGVNVDFEDVPKASQDDLAAFMEELFAAFVPLGLEVSQSVPFDDETYDLPRLARSCHTLVLMAYDEHSAETEAGPVASQGWFAETLAKRMKELPAEKVVVALGSYGYDWLDGTETGAELSFQEAIQTAEDSSATIALDPESLNPAFDHDDEKGKAHHVFFLGGVTVFNQLTEAMPYAPAGIALWRLGSEDPSVWAVLAHRTSLGRSVAMGLRTLRYGYDVNYEGDGEILRVTSTPREGSREIAFEAETGLITKERFLAYPSPYVITRRGEVAKKIALTFDDGPDPVFTPRILDILKAEKAPATFFVIGLNADLHQRLLSRIFDEGHEIGNHSFSHPNISQISGEQLRLEINATERLLESRLGRRSLLFRPPYAEDVEPETPDQVAPLLFTSRRGYTTIGMRIDPNDWQNPGADRIVAETLRATKAGDGNVVLLHDSGGDRSQTVEALPVLIRRLREAGFELVTVSALLGKTRDDVMPALPRRDRVALLAGDGAFLLISVASSLLETLFLAGIVLGLSRLVLIGTLAVAQKLRRRPAPLEEPPAVSVIVPAYNEEKVVVRTVESLLASTGVRMDVVVVDDGSTDATFRLATDRFAGDPRVRVVTKPNGGKAAALNYGLARTESPIVVALDADTLFAEDTVARLVAPFADPRVGAVAGNAKVGNRINLLTRWQALEYITSQNLDRRALDLLNGITVVPGAVGAWRRDLVVQAGGFSPDTLAEDADLTMAILRLGYRVRYEERAVAYTEAPDTVRGFLRQRFRWMFGTLQASWKHRGAFLRPRYGALGLFALPNVLVFQILFPLVSPLMDLQMLVSLLIALWQRYQHPAGYSSDSFYRTLFYYALFVLADFLAAVIAFALEKNERWSLLVWLFLQRFTYRQLMYAVAIRSTLAAIRGGLVGWGKLARQGTVAAIGPERVT